MKEEINKWQIVFKLDRDYCRIEPFMKVLTIGFIKFTSIPEEGGAVGKEHHDGYMLRISFWWPIESITLF